MEASGNKPPKPSTPDKEGLCSEIGTKLAEGQVLTSQDMQAMAENYGVSPGMTRSLLYSSLARGVLQGLGVDAIRSEYKAVQLWRDNNHAQLDGEMARVHREIDDMRRKVGAMSKKRR